MQKNVLLLLVLLVFSLHNLFAQQWGYVTLIAPGNSTTATLIDTNSAVVKQWTGLSGQTGYSSYMMPGGDLWRTVKASTSFSGGGICGRVQKVSWTGTILFDYQINTTEECSHHDICPLANGNVLVIVYEKKTAAEVQAAGATVNAVRWSEAIYELQPTGVNTADIVWEWHLWDHLVQNIDPNKANYQSSIVNHPELLNINYQNTMTDWVHMNGIDYNAGLDQIVVSSHFLNELWVIDHSTTTAQAATHTGGAGGKGGDFLYRWGNPAAYSATGTNVFHVVHDAHWVPDDCPRAGWLGGFNNQGVSNNVSAVDLFQPPLSGGNYTITPGQAYLPATYGYRHTANGYSSNMGNSQQLPNGNMLICLATASKVYEINANGTQLWTYTGSGSIPQAWRYSRCYMESPEIEVVNTNPVMCTGSSVQLDITPSASGANTFTYSWGPSTGLSSTTVQDPVVQGISNSTTYTVTVTTAGGCSVTASVPVTVQSGVTASAGNNVTIQLGQSTTLTASGGGTYMWSNGATTQSVTVSPMATTTYTVTVTSATGCTAEDEVTVTVLSSPTTVNATASPQSICLGNTTQLHANASGGTGAYTYNWASTPAGFSSSESDPEVTPTATTTYRVTVSDGLTNATSSVVVTILPLPNANAGNDVSIVLGTSTSLTATGGGTYEWNTGATTSSVIVSPTSTTTYDVTVTGANGCTKVDDVTVTVTIPPTTVSVSATNTSLCAGEETQLIALPGGGTGNYTYLWSSNPSGFSSGSSEPIVTPNVTTNYSVTVSDGITSTSAAVLIIVNSIPNANAGNNQTIVSGQIATLNATGGGVYLWSNGSTGASVQVAPTATTTYTVTVTSGGNCTNSAEVTVNVLPPATVSASAVTPVFCAGGSTQLNAVAVGGSGNYTYSWTSDPAGFTSTLSNPVVSPVVSTTYTIVVSDGTGTTTALTGVTVNSLPPANAGNDVSVVFGQPADLTATGGNSYVWNTGETTESIVVTPSLTTTYTVTVTNAAGCTATDQVTVTVTGTALSAVVNAVAGTICSNDSTTLSAVVSGGSGSYLFNWTSDPAGFSSTAANPSVAPDVTTVYLVEITDGFTTINGSTTVTVNPSPIANAGDNQSILIGTPAQLIASGGVSYLWNTGENTDTIFVSPSLTTAYTVTVTSANGCTDTDEVSVTVTGTILSVVLNATANTICAGQTTQISAVPSGGTGSYSYSWESSPAGFNSTEASPMVNPAVTTNYLVTISDGNSTITASATIIVNPLPNAGAGSDVTIVAGQSATLISSGGDVYLWSNGATTSAVIVTPGATTTYTVTVTSAAGCTSTDDVTVTVGPSLTASASAAVTAVCAGDSVQLNATGIGGTGNYLYFWTSDPVGFTSNLSNPVVSPSASIIYKVVVQDGLSSASASVNINVNPLPVANAGNDITITGGTVVTLTASGGDFYLWNTGLGTAIISVNPLFTTTYTVTVTTTDGCTDTDQVTVTVLNGPALTATLTATDTVICNGDVVQLFANAVGGSGNYTYDWTSAPAGFTSTLYNPYINPSENTVYTVVISDGLSSVTLSFEVIVNQLPAQPSLMQVNETLVSSEPNGNQWFFYGSPISGANGQVFTPTENGSYQVQTVDANGCFSPLSDPYEFTLVGTIDAGSLVQWNIVPNPANDLVRITGDFNSNDCAVDIWNTTGELVLQVRNAVDIPVASLPSGGYLLRLSTVDGSAARRLIVVH